MAKTTPKTEATTKPAAPEPTQPEPAATEPAELPDDPQLPAIRTNHLATSMIRRDDMMADAFRGLVPSSIGELMQVANFMARSNAVPKGYRGNPEGIFTVALAGLEIGLTPVRALQKIVNIKGNLFYEVELQLAQVRRSGSLEYQMTGYEESHKTDSAPEGQDSLLYRKLRAAKCPDLDDVHDLIIALTEDVPEGRPYGWAVVKRKGDPQIVTKVFTWNDADRVNIKARDDDDDDGGGQQQNRGAAREMKLHEKSNYKNYPQDMYPKRALARAFQVTHSDVLSGMPAAEAMDEYIIEAEVVPQATSSEDAIAQRLNEIKAVHPDLGQTISAGFEQLQMGIAKRLQKLTEYQARPADLVEWLKTEYANRASRGHGRATKDVLSHAATPAATETTTATSQPTTQPATQPPPPTADAAPKADNGPVGDGMSSLKSIADRFKAGAAKSKTF